MTERTLESWKDGFEITGVLLLFLTFIAGAGALWFSRKLNTVQAEQLRQFDKGLTDAKTELGKQEERAAIAEKALREVDTKTEGFRLAIAQANERASKAQLDIAKANERGAKLENEAAVAKLETEKLKQVVAWRIIPPEATTELEKVLSGKPGSVNLRYTDGDPEALFLAIQISQILGKAKWQVAPGAEKFSNAIQFGIALPDSAGADAQTLRSAFAAAKIPFSRGPLPPPGIGFSVSDINGAPTLMIGSRMPVHIP